MNAGGKDDTSQKDRILRLATVLLVLLVTVAVVAFVWLFYSFKETRKNLAVQREAYERQVFALQEEVSHYRQALAAVSPELSAAQRENIPAGAEAALLVSKIKVAAACRDLHSKGYNDLSIYRFNISVDGPQDVVRRIESVSYEFNHPSFRQKILSSSDKPHFQQGYTGWGCLNSVLVHIRFSDPAVEAPPIDFDMCKDLEHKSC